MERYIREGGKAMGLGKSCVVRFTIPSQLLQGFWECSVGVHLVGRGGGRM